MSADSLVPQGPEPVMDRAVANELPNAQMGACGVRHIPLPLLKSSLRYIYTHRRLGPALKVSVGPFLIDAGTGVQTCQNEQSLSKPVVYLLLHSNFVRFFFHCTL